MSSETQDICTISKALKDPDCSGWFLSSFFPYKLLLPIHFPNFLCQMVQHLSWSLLTYGFMAVFCFLSGCIWWEMGYAGKEIWFLLLYCFYSQHLWHQMCGFVSPHPWFSNYVHMDWMSYNSIQLWHELPRVRADPTGYGLGPTRLQLLQIPVTSLGCHS